MEDKLNEFKDFVRNHPGLKDEVSSGKSTYQSFYEAWYLYGPDDKQWTRYKEGSSASSNSTDEVVANSDSETDAKSESGINLNAPEMVAQVFEYLQKVDIDKVQKAMGTVQQFIQIFQTMQTGKGAAAGGLASLMGSKATTPKQNYSGFFSQFDD